jgi:hypothetical protein
VSPAAGLPVQGVEFESRHHIDRRQGSARVRRVLIAGSPPSWRVAAIASTSLRLPRKATP